MLNAGDRCRAALNAARDMPGVGSELEKLFEYVPQFEASNGFVTPTAAGVEKMFALGYVGVNSTVRAVYPQPRAPPPPRGSQANSTSSLSPIIAGLSTALDPIVRQSLAQEGAKLPFPLLPPRWCGTNQTLAQVEVARSTWAFPIWVVHTTTSFITSVVEAVVFMSLEVPIPLPPIVMMSGTIQLPPLAGAVQLPQLPKGSMLVLAGPAPDTRSSMGPSVLDLAQLQGSFPVPPNVTLVLSTMTLLGLASAPLPGYQPGHWQQGGTGRKLQQNATSSNTSWYEQNATSSNTTWYDPYHSAIPLWAISMDR